MHPVESETPRDDRLFAAIGVSPRQADDATAALALNGVILRAFAYSARHGNTLELSDWLGFSAIATFAAAAFQMGDLAFPGGILRRS